MFTRKLQKMGHNTLLVSLPRDWIRTTGLKPKEIVYLVPNSNGTLLIQPESILEAQRRSKSLVIEYRVEEGEAKLIQRLRKAYIMGCDLIRVVKGDEGRWPEGLWTFIDRLTGATVVERSAKEVTVQCFLDITRPESCKLFRLFWDITRTMYQHLGASLTGAVAPVTPMEKLVAERNRLYYLLLRMWMSKAGNLDEETLYMALSSGLGISVARRIGDAMETIAATTQNLRGNRCQCVQELAEFSGGVWQSAEDLFKALLSERNGKTNGGPPVQPCPPAVRPPSLAHLAKHTAEERARLLTLLETFQSVWELLGTVGDWVDPTGPCACMEL